MGSVLPMVVGLYTIPKLINGLGIERFGLLNMGWLLVGYFGLFDLGLGRALTRLVSERISLGETENISIVVCTAMRVIFLLAIGSCLLFVTISQDLSSKWLHLSFDLEFEAFVSSLILGFTLPFVVLSAGWRGVLEAYGRFDLVNWVRIPLGLAIFLTPLLVLFFFDGLIPVVIALALTRIAGWFFFRYLCFHEIPSLSNSSKFDWGLMRPLLSSGGWMTVSNIVGPLMVYSDRFLIAGIISATAVAYYSAPYEIVTRLWIVPGALTGVLFPIISGRYKTDRLTAILVYENVIKIVFLSILPLVAFSYLFAEEGLQLWLGSDFAINSYLVARILVIGVFMNSLGQVAITVLQGAGKANWAAKLHLFELPFYVFILILCATRFGIQGVAIAWLIRVVFDTVVMFILVQSVLESSISFTWIVSFSSGIVVFLVGVFGEVNNYFLKFIFLGLLLLACAILLPRQLRLLSNVTC